MIRSFSLYATIVVLLSAAIVPNICAFTTQLHHKENSFLGSILQNQQQGQIITNIHVHSTSTVLYGYLDDLKKYTTDPEPEKVEDDSREATNMSLDQIDRYGPGDLRQFVDFNEFDGGDGRKLSKILQFSFISVLGVLLMCEYRKRI
jgi:type II secretory pathway pseudopilin PulG